MSSPIPTSTESGSKIRDDASERSWTQEQWAWVLEKFIDAGWGYDKVISEAKQCLGLKISRKALQRIWAQEQERRLASQAQLNRIRVATQTAREVQAACKDATQDITDATLGLIAQHAFEFVSAPNFDPKALKTLITALLKSRDQDVERRRLKLLEDKAAEAKDKLSAVVNKGGLSPETLQQIEEAAGLL